MSPAGATTNFSPARCSPQRGPKDFRLCRARRRLRRTGECDCATVPVLAEILASVAALDDAGVVVDVNKVQFIEAALVPYATPVRGRPWRIAQCQPLLDSARVHHSFGACGPSALSFPSVPLFDSFVREPGPIKEGVCHEGHRRH